MEGFDKSLFDQVVFNGGGIIRDIITHIRGWWSK